MKKHRVLIVGAQHGNELLGPHLWDYINQERPDLLASVEYVCGNPEARRQNTRFIETDLNRSYAPSAEETLTYEQERAQEILQLIRSSDYDYVLDMHTTTADVGSMFVTVRLDGVTQQVMNASAITKIAYMPSAIGVQSLIGQVPQAISVEVNKDLAQTPELIQEMTLLVENLVNGSQQPAQPREVFFIQGTIPLSTNLDDATRNFQKTAHGFYPVLFGEVTYTQHQGFAANKVETIDI